jgi:hypothetical protein
MAEQAEEDTPSSRSCRRPSRPNWHGRQLTTQTTCSYRPHGGRTVPAGSFVITSGHNIRGYLAEGHTTEQATSLVMREAPAWPRFMPTDGLLGHRRVLGLLGQLRKGIE